MIIALLSCVGKLIEKMVLNHLDWDLTIWNEYAPQMTGFRQFRSSIDNVLALVNYIKSAKAEHHFPLAVFIDIIAAFDFVADEAIRSAMESIGIGGRMCPWILDYLSERSVFISKKDGETASHNVTQGVPQGGILNPTLFNISLIEIEKCGPQTVEITLYADDICIWSSQQARFTSSPAKSH